MASSAVGKAGPMSLKKAGKRLLPLKPVTLDGSLAPEPTPTVVASPSSPDWGDIHHSTLNTIDTQQEHDLQPVLSNAPLNDLVSDAEQPLSAIWSADAMHHDDYIDPLSCFNPFEVEGLEAIAPEPLVSEFKPLNPESAPEADQNPELAPEADQNPESAPEADQNPEAAPEADQNPESAPEADQNPEAAPEADQNPESAPEADPVSLSTPELAPEVEQAMDQDFDLLEYVVNNTIEVEHPDFMKLMDVVVDDVKAEDVTVEWVPEEPEEPRKPRRSNQSDHTFALTTHQREQRVRCNTEAERYQRTRVLNNKASQRCRAKRRMKIQELMDEEVILKEKNSDLKIQLNVMQEQVDNLKKLFLDKIVNPQQRPSSFDMDTFANHVFETQH